MLKKVLIVVLAACAAAGVAFAEEDAPSEAERVGRAYMQAYSDANWDGMARFMGDAYVLIDRTNPDPDFVPEHHGRQGALGMLRAFGREQGVIELGFVFPTVFESNNIVVFSGHVNVYAAPPGVDYAYRWRAEQVTVLTIRDGRVVRHEDYANYRTPSATRVPRP